MTDNTNKQQKAWENTQNNKTQAEKQQVQQPNQQQSRVVQRAVRQSYQWWKVKQWSNIWGKRMLVWIWIFILVLILLMFFFFFYLTANPNMARWLGMWAGMVKQITSIFAWILFWLLFIIFLFMWLSYIYKLMTKTSWKWKNTAWAIIIFILWVTNLVLGWVVFARINAIQVEEQIETQEVLIANMLFSDPTDHSKKIYLPSYKNNYPLIAPTAISFSLNTKVFNNSYLIPLRSKSWNIAIQKFMLDCWNGSTIDYDPSKSFSLDKYCLYMKKWEYRIKLKFIYDTKNQTNQTFNLPWQIINIKSEIEFKSDWKLTENKNEIIVWETTDEVSIDLRKIPNDFSMKQNIVDVDFEWNWKFISEKWIVKHVYNKDWQYNITIRLPWKEKENYPLYSIPIRISPSTKPTCTISMKENRWQYIFAVKWTSPDGAIRKYSYSINNLTNGDKSKGKSWTKFPIHFQNGSDYQVEWTVIDSKWNVWKCVSSTIELSNKKKYEYNLVILDEKWETATWEDNNIILNEIPKTYTLEIKDINLDWIVIPLEWDIVYWFDTNGDWEIDVKNNKIEFTVKWKEWSEVNAIVKDIYWNQEVKNIKFSVNQKKLIAILNLDQNKWEAPLKVSFDASTSKINAENDSIIYFDWDFGDWEKLDKTKQWNIDHTYDKPWEYVAKVSIKSEKGEKDTATKSIFVRRQWKTSNIIFPENLGWQAKMSVWVKIELQTDWLIKNISRDFGDWDKLDCSWRECIWVNHTYKKKWVYNVSARVEYSDGSPSVTANASINIIE